MDDQLRHYKAKLEYEIDPWDLNGALGRGDKILLVDTSAASIVGGMTVSYNRDGTAQSRAIFRREYDEHGNWIKELVSTAPRSDAERGTVTSAHVTRRTITYE